MKKKIIVNKSRIGHWIMQLPTFDLLGVIIFIILLGFIFLLFPRKSTYITILLEVTKDNSIEQSNVEEWNRPAFWFADRLQSSTLKKVTFFNQTEIEVEHIFYPDNNGEKWQTVLLEMKIRSIYNKQTKQYSYNGVPLIIGSAQRFKFENILINGVIRDVYVSSGEKRNSSYIFIHAYLEPLQYPPLAGMSVTNLESIFIDGIPTYFSKKIRKGMKVKSYSDQDIAEIVDVIKQPGKRNVISNGQMITIIDENREKVDVVVKILVEQYGNNYYFMERYPVLIGRILEINFDLLPLSLIITDIDTK